MACSRAKFTFVWGTTGYSSVHWVERGTADLCGPVHAVLHCYNRRSTKQCNLLTRSFSEVRSIRCKRIHSLEGAAWRCVTENSSALENKVRQFGWKSQFPVKDIRDTFFFFNEIVSVLWSSCRLTSVCLHHQTSPPSPALLKWIS
jgi:hypothetical protein